MKSLLIICLHVIRLSVGEDSKDEFYFGTFPDDFVWSTATASYQVEGGWNADGQRRRQGIPIPVVYLSWTDSREMTSKNYMRCASGAGRDESADIASRLHLRCKGPSIWDTYTSRPGNVDDGRNGSVACDSYHKYREDVQLIKSMGMSHYRFSISWPRVMPDGTLGSLNPAGVKYYSDLINELGRNGIKPMVTLYHWDLPQALEDRGGWLNEDTARLYVEYARFCFAEYGDRVKFWITLNEPWVVAYHGYGTGAKAPGQWGPGTKTYQAGHNLIKAHAGAYRAYDTDYRHKHGGGGKVGITLSFPYHEPKNPSDQEHVDAAERGNQFTFGWFADPVLVNGDYPEVMRSKVNQKSQQAGLNTSRLPTFTQTEKLNNNGTADFIGLNYYTNVLVSPKVQPFFPPSYVHDQDVEEYIDPSWPRSGSSWLYYTPTGARHVLTWIRDTYNNVPVYVTENGVSDRNGSLVDTHRIHYYRDYLNEMLKAIRLDGCNLKGHTSWSLMDNFEWSRGFTERFGLHYVDVNDPARPRTPKASSHYLASVISDNGFKPGFSRPGGKTTGVPPFQDEFYYGQFPKNFGWAAASSSYQTEGGVLEGNRTESIWDVFSHVPRRVQGGATGDVAADSYHRYKEDVKLLKELNANHYRFSISWGRIMHNVSRDSKNEAGIAYYNSLLDELVAQGIQPIVTLFHWDLPQHIQDRGGWMNPEVVTWFDDYARVCFEAFGDRVKKWITINEPVVFALTGYEKGVRAPGTTYPTSGTYPVIRNLLLAHAQAYRTYKTEFSYQRGQCALCVKINWYEPADPYNQADVGAAERALEFNSGLAAEPVFGNGQFPQVVLNQVEKRCRDRKYHNCSLIVPFTSEEQALLKGSSDFFALNHYRSVPTKEGKLPVSDVPSFDNDKDVHETQSPPWDSPSRSEKSRQESALGLRKVLNRIKYRYNNVPVFITENGVPTAQIVDDKYRVDFHKRYINEVLKATVLDGCNVLGYTVWSLLDSFEWQYGYTRRYGLFQVDFTHPDRPRTAKASARWYSQVIAENGFKRGYRGIGGLNSAAQYVDEFYYGKFPDGFVWSAATASYQVEGGYNADGKGESIWDVFTAVPGHVVNGQTGQVACDSYHKYKQDVAMLKHLGVSHYRFSISWSRILPDGTTHNINRPGIDYYNNLINELLKSGIEPMVTIYHWDLPQALQLHGGWLNESIVDQYTAYARLCFESFGDRVKMWITFNEPWVTSYFGYGTGSSAPGLREPGTFPYIATHNIIRAHTGTYRMYYNHFWTHQQGKVGITLNAQYNVPRDPLSISDIRASDLGLQWFLGWYSDPIFGSGDYPEYMKTRIAELSRKENLTKSRLPEFTKVEIHQNKGSADFYGLNLYTASRIWVEDPPAGTAPDYSADSGLQTDQDPSWLGSGSSWLKVTPFAIRRTLNWFRNRYGDYPIYVTENGVSDRNGSLDDTHRVSYYRAYINEVLKAVNLDQVNVKGYTAWSLMDNFEWGSGFTEKFGLYFVNFSDPERPRSPKASAAFYHRVIKDNGFTEGSPTDPLRSASSPFLDQMLYGMFPSRFLWGASSSAYGTEGAWNKDGRIPSVLDVMTGGYDPREVQSDSYRHYMEDVAALRMINAKSYSFSISWSRVMSPENDVNELGVAFYNNLINALTDAGIQPIVSLHYWDHPQWMENNRGWKNESHIEHFKMYADTCFKRFGDRVKRWISHNKPYEVADWYGQERYRAVVVLLKAHAAVYHLYQRRYKSTQHGKIGIAVSADWPIPANPRDPADNDAADRSLDFRLGMFMDPVLGSGRFPASVERYLPSDLISAISEDTSESLTDTVDFVGLDYRRAWTIENVDSDPSVQGFVNNEHLRRVDAGEVSETASYEGLRELLKHIRHRYNNPEVIITEIGVKDGESRSEFIKHTVNEVLKAITVDGCDVTGYTVRSLVDSYEIGTGYHAKWGLFHVNFSEPTRQRVPKQAAVDYRNLIVNNGFFKDSSWLKPTGHVNTISTTPTPTSNIKVCSSGEIIRLSSMSVFSFILFHVILKIQTILWV